MASFEIERLRQLPQRPSETWQGGWVRIPSWTCERGQEPYRPWAPLWISLQTGKVHSGELCRPEGKDFGKAVAALVDFACDEKIVGYRPGKLEVNDPALAERLSGMLAELGIKVAHREKLLAVARCLKAMAQDMSDGPSIPGPLDVPGVTVERMRSFAEAAQAFHRAAVWQHLSDEDLIRIEAPPAGEGLGCTVVLGAGGHVHGLGFFRSPEDYWRTYERAGDRAETYAGLTSDVWSLLFNDITEIPLADADLWEDHDLPVADKRAYPFASCLTARGRIRRPSSKALAFLEGLMRALAASTEDEIDTGRWTKQTDTVDGPVAFTLALPGLLEPPKREELARRGVMPDRRGMEWTSAQIHRYLDEHPVKNEDELRAVLDREFIGKRPEQMKLAARTPLEEAQDLCYQAFNARGRRQVQMAKKAIEICSDCADAYVILAERTGDPGKACGLYAKGVEAGEKALGQERLEEGAGHFWGMIDTRPYMRARFGLAQCLDDLDRTEEAVEHYQELLRLNPSDNQGVRYVLVPRLIQLGRDSEASGFLHQFEEDIGATWRYSRALLAFREGGDGPTARKLLREAVKANPHVPKYLVAEEEMPPALPGGYRFGSEEEAVICVTEIGEGWDETPGAISWLEEQCKHGKRGR